MKRGTMRRSGGSAVLFWLLAGLSGCTDYVVETTVNPDGSGVRETWVELDPNDDVVTPAEAYPGLMHFTPAEGWSHTVTKEENEVVTHHFHRRTTVQSLAQWSGVSGTFVIDGTTAGGARERVGYVTLGEVRFSNAVRVGRGETSDGNTTLTYRETFSWDQVRDAMVEFFVEEVERALKDRYPRLNPSEVGQILGSLRARYWVAFESGLLEGDSDDDAILEELVHNTAAQGVKIVRTKYPGEDAASLSAVIRNVVMDESRAEGLVRKLPGLELALNSHIVFRLKLPGQVVDSNAHRVEDGALVWEFGPDDAMEAPVEIRAESVVRR